MKSTKKEIVTPTFPKLQQSLDGNVFLMSNHTCGMCVHSPTSNFLGTYHTDLYLKDFNGSITLEN